VRITKAVVIFEESKLCPVPARQITGESVDASSEAFAPGRAYGSVGQIRSSVGETDWHELQKERFAVSIAEQINKAAMSNAFSQIVIVAPAKILGDLRREFTKETESKIVAEIGKDLTRHTIAEIERLLMAH
jgi:protein required for attachment to host cells